PGTASSCVYRIPRPPPRSTMRGVHASSCSARSQKATSRSTARRLSSTRASCEPTWKCTPATSSPTSPAARIACSAASGGIPNFDASCAVRTATCVTASTPGVRRTRTRRPRERELAERRDVGADALLGEDAEDRDVRERLRPVDDECTRRRARIRTRLRTDRLLAVHDERRAVLRGEPLRGHAADRERAALDARRIREQLEHHPASIKVL